jgi:CO/xanthine dehydrogenase Mo-binding subunit
MSKTPETDAEWERSREKRIYDLFAPEYMMRDLAKKLELERDQFRRQVEVLAEEPPKFVKS